MLSRLLPERNIHFTSATLTWREAITQVAAPLLEAGDITPEYVRAMQDSVEAGGTYIDLGHGIALAHARPERGVVRTGIAMLRLREPAPLLDLPEHAVDLYFCFAAADADAHMRAMASLARILSDADTRQALRDAGSAPEVTKLITEFEESE
ncbi:MULTISPECIES: PTS sugar transporter subunit IIA [Streptomyces]|uniref:Ascorbate-specific PTS system EIIA component n=1 Tax=Streptomyces doudnae TaxID=3075536 RepID=A0ABD5EQ86_9ACTN|nr:MULTISPECIES: PTS sugar transporter subunit IIA [unclassified Streptomyces]MDT0436458.1 PTS sugar transporter subunit IIA [Streptomyces sp. DSM 41981]MYQ65917.1 PTS transporter subunit EIIA [Streptomyces sp. SID4950]SCE10300.1 Phosphotransferase system mannitol/fructose-specific IIA domain (Ntr-type) [Streptomyces sp. SolWspMP-5a-2]